MQLEPRKFILILVMLWCVSIFTSLTWNMFQQNQSFEIRYVKTARAFVQQILITRSWNASHGGIYLRVSDSLQPNPFLQVPDRDIETSNGTQLTLINPAFMTRMISEISGEQGQIKFHLTSLKPINPGNKAVPWERIALRNFEEHQEAEYYFLHKDNNTEFFSYMVPLVTEKACLKCHEKQGYREGDIRGGLSVTFPIDTEKTGPLVISHLFLLFAGVLFIVGLGSRLIRLTESLKKQSCIDGLTQIANRKYFDETLHQEWLRSRRMKTPLSLLICDIDHFKPYNDTYGHQAGDKCLKQVATALNMALNRPADLAARYGGEEFVVILPETHGEGARFFAELIQTSIEKLQILHEASQTSGYVTISVGVATMASQVIPQKNLIGLADRALYFSKDNGRNTFTHADDL